MTKHSGPPAEGVPPRAHRERLLKLGGGLVATLIAWIYLVSMAIDFGSAARDGDGLGWLLLIMATLGATACMFVALILGNKVLATLRGEVPPPAGSGGGRRAAR